MTNTSTTTIVLIVASVVFVAWSYRRRTQTKKKDDLRRLWRQKIEQIADNRSTDSNGLSLDDLMDLFDLPYWKDVYFELEKMPAGKRLLRKAIEITGKDDYKRFA
jgi:hypothetical protein